MKKVWLLLLVLLIVTLCACSHGKAVLSRDKESNRMIQRLHKLQNQFKQQNLCFCCFCFVKFAIKTTIMVKLFLK